jgi:hypothetical protein
LPEDLEKNWSVDPGISPRLVWIFVLLTALGIATFLFSLQLDPLRGWQVYLVNFLFWAGIAQGAVVFAAVYRVVGARWGATVRRLGEGAAACLPVNLVLFLPLYFGLKRFFSGVRHVNPNRGAWFDPRFIFIRGGLGLGLMTVLSLFFAYYSLRPEIGIARERQLKLRIWLHRWMIDGWQGAQLEAVRCERGVGLLSAGVLLAYPMVYTFMAFDLIMALDPFWYSSLFGGYFFVSTFYLGLAGLAVVAALLRRKCGDLIITASQLSDLGKLLLGFNLTYMSMVWAQYIVIWYGNLPEETHFIILRVWEMPWAIFSWSVLVLSVLVPFLFFLSRRAKQLAWVLFLTGISISAGLWIERYVLIVPSVWDQPAAPFGWIEVGVTLGFFGATGLSYVYFLKNFPLIPYSRVSVPALPQEPKFTEETA